MWKLVREAVKENCNNRSELPNAFSSLSWGETARPHPSRESSDLDNLQKYIPGVSSSHQLIRADARDTAYVCDQDKNGSWVPYSVVFRKRNT